MTKSRVLRKFASVLVCALLWFVPGEKGVRSQQFVAAGVGGFQLEAQVPRPD